MDADPTPISPEVAAHVAKFISVEGVEVPRPGEGFLVIRADGGYENADRLQAVGAFLAQQFGCLIVVANHKDGVLDFDKVGEEDMRALGWVRA